MSSTDDLFSSLDQVPPERVDRIVAWCGLKYPSQVRDAAIDGLRQMHGIPPGAAP